MGVDFNVECNLIKIIIYFVLMLWIFITVNNFFLRFDIISIITFHYKGNFKYVKVHEYKSPGTNTEI